MKNVILRIFFCAPIFCYAQRAEIVKFDALQKILDSKGGKIQIINFWATWCAPCVKELPLFERLTKESKPNVTVTLINLNFADEIEKVNIFIKRKKMATRVLLLDEIDYNKWIDKVDKTWSGAIPSTLILNTNTGQRKFIEKELLEGDLQKLINEVI